MSGRRTKSMLDRMEKALPPTDDPYADWLDDYDWLAEYEAWAEEGRFDEEPDAPQALESCRSALRAAEASVDPPFDPPSDGPDDLPLPLRLLNRRHEYRFPVLREASGWVHEIAHRILHRIPPVTLEGFADLAEWHRAHEDRLWAGKELRTVGNGRRVAQADIRYGIAQGAKASGAGELAQHLRVLRQQCPAEGAG